MRSLFAVRTSLTAACALLLAACQKPTEVQLTPDDSSVEVQGVAATDPSLDNAPVDTTALLPADQLKYNGFVTLSAVTYDLGLGAPVSGVFARVVIENKGRFVLRNGKRIFFGQSLGVVRVNNLFMLPRFRIPGVDSSGFEYVREIPDHQPRRPYTFTGDSLAVTIESPENINVLSPAGGTRARRDRDLDLQWTGQGSVSLVVSNVTIGSGRLETTPILSVRPKINNGRAVVPRRILQGLPSGTYMFTFILANRREYQVARYAGKVLVQASSIYNVRVDLI